MKIRTDQTVEFAKAPYDYDFSAHLVIGQGRRTPQQKAKHYLQEHLTLSLYDTSVPSHLLVSR